MRLLLVEDDEILGDALRSSLSHEGFAVDWLRNGNHAAQALSSELFDLLVLDLGLPGCDGLDVLRSVRAAGNTIPTLVLTARDTVEDRVVGLDSGADDYMVKPFDLEELLARTRSLLRRAHGRAAPNIVHKDIDVSPESHTVCKNGQPVSLTAKEYEVLVQLLEHRGQVLTRQRLKEALYGWDCDDVDSNTIEVHVSHIRKKLDTSLIRTIRGVGYIIEREII